MLSQTMQSLQSALALKGVRRVLWLFFVLAACGSLFEMETNYFEIHSVDGRLALLTEAGKLPVGQDDLSTLTSMKSRLVVEMAALEAKRDNRPKTLLAAMVRFLKGAWFGLVIAWVVFKKTIRSQLAGDGAMKMAKANLGFLAMSGVLWITTLLGFFSMWWNLSSGFWMSWLVFPLLSIGGLVVVAIWIAILRHLLPKGPPSPTPP